MDSSGAAACIEDIVKVAWSIWPRFPVWKNMAMDMDVPSGNLLSYQIENRPVEIVSLPGYEMVDLSSSFSVNVGTRG